MYDQSGGTYVGGGCRGGWKWLCEGYAVAVLDGDLLLELN